MAEFDDEHEPFITKTPELHQPEARQQVKDAGRLTASEHARSLRELARVRRDVVPVFSRVDLLVLPTVLTPPLHLAEVTTTPLSILTLAIPFNFYDLPALTLPGGFTKAGLPIGLQIVGPRFGEPRVLAPANAYEQATEWHKRRPAL
jgi:aspartyl-tRNA(Asn)/glutamyl-tRNA(Gln) amidotransferase subunit A